MAVCYRHPNRETGVSCSSCGRPICPDCMTPTPVGMRCPECARQRTKVRTARTMSMQRPVATLTLIGVNVAVFVEEGATAKTGGIGTIGGGGILEKLALDGRDVANGDWWRLVTSGFLHAGLLHIALNMYI